MTRCLNRSLYDSLVRRFGTVKIAAPGQKAINVEPGAYRQGEYYRVCCPACGDRRYRLWISYLWGSKDDDGRRLLHLLHCFNENCEQRGALDLQYELSPYMQAMDIPADVSTTQQSEFTLLSPGKCIRLDRLPDDAVQRKFVRHRNFDPDDLGRSFGISACIEPDNRLLVEHPWLYTSLYNRLIIPVVSCGRVFGWQARYVDYSGDGTPPYQTPKYITAPGFQKSRYLFNWDNAIRGELPFGIVVEGPFDAMRLSCAVSPLGHSLSREQRDLLWSAFRNTALVIVFDRDARDETLKLRDELWSSYRNGVVVVELPDERDPADYQKEDIMKMIYSTADQQRIKLVSSPAGAR